VFQRFQRPRETIIQVLHRCAFAGIEEKKGHLSYAFATKHCSVIFPPSPSPSLPLSFSLSLISGSLGVIYIDLYNYIYIHIWGHLNGGKLRICRQVEKPKALGSMLGEGRCLMLFYAILSLSPVLLSISKRFEQI